MNKLNNIIRRFRSLCKTQGIMQTLKMGFMAVFVKPFRLRYLYARHHSRYPLNLIFIAGYAKSGSSWFAHMLAELDGFTEMTSRGWMEIPESGTDPHPVYPGFSDEFRQRLAIVKGHSWGSQSNLSELKAQGVDKYIVTVRDPRDAMISAYWYIRKRPHHWDYPNVSSMTLDEFINHKLTTGEFEQQYVGWLKNWSDKLDQGCLLVRYEDLLGNTEKEMQRVFDYLGIQVDQEQLHAIIDKHSFTKVAGRKRGMEDTSKFARKAISGEWKTIFSDEQRQIAAQAASGILEAFGYDV